MTGLIFLVGAVASCPHESKTGNNKRERMIRPLLETCFFKDSCRGGGPSRIEGLRGVKERNFGIIGRVGHGNRQASSFWTAHAVGAPFATQAGYHSRYPAASLSEAGLLQSRPRKRDLQKKLQRFIFKGVLALEPKAFCL